MSEENKSKGLVSVVVPVYKTEEYLDECVKSVVSQTYSEFELLLIDDGSPDGAPELCDAWARKDNRIRVIHQVNRGLSAARNTGLSECVGEYVVFLDSDDTLMPTALESSIAQLDKYNAELCLFNYRRILETGSETESFDNLGFPDTGITSGFDALRLVFAQQIQCYAPMRTVRKSFYDSIGFRFPLDRNLEDMATTPILLGKAKKIAFLNEALYCYRSRPESITEAWNWKLTQEAQKAFADVSAYVKREHPSLLYEMMNYQIKFLIWCWAQMVRIDAKDNRLESLRLSIRNAVHTMGLFHLSKRNCLKYVALETHLLSIAVRSGLL